jgi:chemosensory pili system protein ChpA (sensor histidine kinase/response regulator)
MHISEDSFAQFSLLSAEAVDEFWSILSINAAVSEDEPAPPVLSAYMAIIERLSEAAEAAALAGLQTALAMLEANLQAVQEEERELNLAELGLLEEVPELLMGYVIGQGDANSVEALLKNMGSTNWMLPLGEEDLDFLTELLLSSPSEEVAIEEHKEAFTFATRGQAPLTDISEEETYVVEASEPAILVQELILDAPAVEAQLVDSAMIQMLNKEFALMTEQINEDLAAAVSTHFSASERHTALTNYADMIERLGMAAESVGLIALGKVFIRFKLILGDIEGDISSTQHTLLEQLPGRVASYLAWPNDQSSCAALIDLLVDSAWPTPIALAETNLWINALVNVELQESLEQRPERQSDATEEDVSLDLPEDINAELLDGLLQELPLQTAAFTSAIERISTGLGNASDVNRAMRAAHTLKGAANTVGVRGIANLTHHLEDILVALTEESVLPDKELSAMLVNAGDCLEAMSEALMGVGPTPEQSLEVFQSVLDYANRIDNEGVGVVATNIVSTIEQDHVSTEVDNQKDATQDLNQREQGQGLRVSAPVVDELLRLAGETLISNSQIQDRLRQTVKQGEAMQHQQNLVGQLIAELENLVDIRGIAAPLEKLRADGDFDPLEFDNFSELHTVTRRLIEASSDSQQILSQVKDQFSTLSDLLEVQQRLQMANQHAVIRTRMVPVSSIVSRLQRSVRQTCRLLDKQVELKITGDTTNIDSNVLTDLMDPLMHILRNAVDHGIDEPALRVAAGKPATGSIELSFAREGNSIVVRCKDDGAGLDYEAIRRIAASKGIIPPERNPSPEELARLILVNGFSTRDETTHVSGRGVGMDIVYNRVLQMKGTLALNSESGRGLAVELRLPATLLSAHTLIVRHGEKLIAVSSRGVEDIHYVTPDQIELIGSQSVYRVGNAVHSLIKLESLLALPPDRREADRMGFPVLLTRMDNGSINAILVQEVMDGREVVLKNFGHYVPKIQGAIGAVILGDGSVAPVIDMVELLRVPVQHSLSDSSSDGMSSEHPNELHNERTALVVDDSLTARRAAAKVMKDAGFTVRTAIDGLEAVTILQNFVPSIMLVDMEMPRMNGLELTSHVRNAEHTKHVPVIMITSRSTEKHRQQAKTSGVDVYLTKPFADEVLLDHVAQLTGQ